MSSSRHHKLHNVLSRRNLRYFQVRISLKMDSNNWNVTWVLCFGVISAMAVAGNTVTLLILLKRKLRKRPHFLLISLAVADLLVGLLAIPLYMSRHYDVYEGHVVRAIADWTDMFTGLTSIFTLAVISLERMYAIGWPYRHRVLKCRSYITGIVIPWILALAVASTGIALKPSIAFLAALIVCLSTPIVLACTAYFVLWMKERSRLISRRVQEARELKLAKTVALIAGAFLFTWLPFEILILVYHLCTSCRDFSPVVLYTIKLLHFSNSVINVVIYPVRNVEYRTALAKMLCSCKYN